MNNEQDKELDDLFKRELEDPVDKIGYKEEDWGSLEQMLNKHKKKRGVVYWLPVLSSAAALLLMFLGYWYFRSKAIHNPKDHAQVAVQKKSTGKSDGSTRQPGDHKQNNPLSPDYAQNSRKDKVNSRSKSFFPLSAAGARRDTTGYSQNNIVNKQPALLLSAVNQKMVFEPETLNLPAVYTVDIPHFGTGSGSDASKNNKIKTSTQSAFHPRYALTVLAASDLNGVGSFQQSEVGSNAGLLFSAGVSRKFTISTGVIYSDKPYTTSFDNYHTAHQFAVAPTNVAASCQMLDIPLNLGYQLYNKHQNRISVGTGFSSYIMLHETYKFNYSNSYIANSSYTVPNSSSYFFSILNLNATYERQLNSKVGISVQPYLKLPLTNIGYSQARLQTTGVAVGLSWNLNTLKP